MITAALVACAALFFGALALLGAAQRALSNAIEARRRAEACYREAAQFYTEAHAEAVSAMAKLSRAQVRAKTVRPA